jgi:hypothetical protein
MRLAGGTQDRTVLWWRGVERIFDLHDPNWIDAAKLWLAQQSVP